MSYLFQRSSAFIDPFWVPIKNEYFVQVRSNHSVAFSANISAKSWLYNRFRFFIGIEKIDHFRARHIPSFKRALTQSEGSASGRDRDPSKFSIPGFELRAETGIPVKSRKFLKDSFFCLLSFNKKYPFGTFVIIFRDENA